MGSFEEMEVKKRVLQQRSTELHAAIASAKQLPNKGTVVAIKLPDSIRERLDAQAESWELPSHKKMVLAAMLLGLDQMEQMDKLKREPANVRRQAPEFQDLLGSNGSGDSPARTG